MKTQKLIPLLDYVLEQKPTETLDMSQIDWYEKELQRLDKITNYAKFLSQPLKLSQFVPCDENGNILEEPNNLTEENFNEVNPKIQKYYKAKSNVLFEGWKIYDIEENTILVSDKNDNIMEFTDKCKYIFDEYTGYVISDLCFYSEKEEIEITLTENAVKLING